MDREPIGRKKTAMEDQQIIQLYWERREQAIWESDRKYGAYCRSIARRILAVEEDAVLHRLLLLQTGL